jgi:lysophospholipase L1-like esterase
MRVRDRLLSSFLAISFLAVAACTKNPESPTGPTPGPDVVIYTAVGASDTIGFGGSIPCVPFDPECSGGTGYVYLLKRRLQAAGKTVTLNNRGVPGAVLSPAIQALARSIGRDDVLATFIDQIVPFVPVNTTHVTIFAGGNDANAIAQAVRAGQGGGDIRGFIDRHVQQWGTDFEDLVRRLRARAPSATRIVALNLPNLAGLPYVSRNTVAERSILQRIAVGLSDRVNAMASQNALVVDLLCDPRVYNPANVSADGFHPSDQGYQLFAEVAIGPLANGAGSTPAGSCAQRTIVPAF